MIFKTLWLPVVLFRFYKRNGMSLDSCTFDTYLKSIAHGINFMQNLEHVAVTALLPPLCRKNIAISLVLLGNSRCYQIVHSKRTETIVRRLCPPPCSPVPPSSPLLTSYLRHWRILML